MNLEGKDLKELFKIAKKIGNRRYHKLTDQDLEDYKKFNNWRYINGELEYGTTQDSKDWVNANSDWYCPICEEKYSERSGKTIDHKLPRAQYPWLSMDFRNLWVICWECNQEKAEMNWYEYELFMLTHHPDLYPGIRAMRPTKLLKSLED